MIWKQFFIPIWNQHNASLQSDTSVAAMRDEEMLDKTLHKFKLNYRELLHYTQYHLVDYTDDQIERWSIDKKQKMVSILRAARLSYMRSVRDRDNKQSLITGYWK